MPDIDLMGATYPDVPAVTLPTHEGGTATFYHPDEIDYAASPSSGGNAVKANGILYAAVDSTSTSTVFTATVEGLDSLYDGVAIMLHNGVVTSAKNFTVNVNGLGAKKCYSSLTNATQETTIFNVAYTLMFVYSTALGSGNGGWWVYRGIDTNTTYTPVKLGFGYGHCTTAAATAAKAVAISGYTLNTGGIVTVLFDNDVPAGATLNVTSKGAKAIYHKGAAITGGIIKAGDTATFMYSGQYHLVSVDRDAYTLPPATASTLGGVKVGDGLSVAVDGTLSSDIDTGMVVLEYGVSTYQDFEEAYNANKLVYCKVASSTSWRYAFLAFVNPTSHLAEFQYYRSISSHTDSQQGDEVYVYTLRSDNSWTTVTRKASTRVVAGDGLSSSYSNGTITLNAVGGGGGGIADGSVTTAKLADGAVTIPKLSDEANAIKEIFAGLHIEKSQSYSSNYTYNVDVYVPKGAVCSITNNSDTNSNIGVHYNGVSTQFDTGLPTGTTFRFVAENTITRVWQYTTGGTLNAFTFDVQPMWLGGEVESLEQRFMPENLFNLDADGVQSGWIHTDTGAITASGSWSTSDYIPIEVGKTYSHPAAVSLYGATGAKRVPCFDAEKNWVGYFRGTIDANNVLTFTVPSRLSEGTGGVYRYDHVYARFTYSNANRGSVMFVEGAQPSEYIAYGAGKLATNFGLNQKQKDEVVELVGDSASPLYGKKIAYNGDSICESRLNTSSLAYNGGAYAKIISDITGCTYENRAHSGGILASATGDGTTAARYVVSDVENMAADADLICFEGGINDYWTKVPLGTYSESDYTGTLDTTTICGALESIFRQATAKWVGKPICFVIVHKITSTVYTQNSAGYTFAEAREKMLGICAKYAIPVFDAFAESGLNAYNGVQNNNFLTANANGTPDGCHPNEAGYKAFYVPQLIALFESLISRT